MRFLFVKSRLAWPRSSGHDVHTFGMMKALTGLGHEVGLLTRDSTTAESIAGANVHFCKTFSELPTSRMELHMTRLQRRFASYWGIDDKHIGQTAALASEWKADAVVVVGLEVLPYLAAVPQSKRIWYAADEWVLHHLSQVFIRTPSTWHHARAALIKGLYERAFASRVDRVWVVSERDARAIRWVMRTQSVDLIVNGVDAEHFAPKAVQTKPFSCVFWGRLDFGPNVDAIRWFAKNVWPTIRNRFPQASFTVYGFNPTEEVDELARQGDFQVIPNLPDIRDEVSRHEIVVLPFVSGAGIKNKFLEAAAMGKPIVVSPSAIKGVPFTEKAPCKIVSTSDQWLEVLTALWQDEARRRELGDQSRRWATQHATWNAAACEAIKGLTS